MVKVNLGGCASFVKDEDYKKYVGKALEAFDVLESESGAGNDFLGWKHLPSQTPESLIADCEAVRDCWKAKGVNLVVVIGIGGSYLGARCAIEALSHNFAKQLGGAKEAPEVVFAGNNLSEEYLAELMDLVAERNVATVVISKSGTTTEPAVAFRIVKEHIEKTYKDASERIVAITDAHKGALKTLSTQEGYKTFVVPDNVGGRFSVLTPVGLLPIVLAGFDHDQNRLHLRRPLQRSRIQGLLHGLDRPVVQGGNIQKSRDLVSCRVPGSAGALLGLHLPQRGRRENLEAKS